MRIQVESHRDGRHLHDKVRVWPAVCGQLRGDLGVCARADPTSLFHERRALLRVDPTTLSRADARVCARADPTTLSRGQDHKVRAGTLPRAGARVYPISLFHGKHRGPVG